MAASLTYFDMRKRGKERREGKEEEKREEKEEDKMDIRRFSCLKLHFCLELID